ncbi:MULTISPECIES: FAD-dependent oxidoreductase [Comamonadaceae]|uniref:NAD(P)/FAD-dependent oxidoreductase n=1 Tax=Comamonadaceae TaxID=80864 RepID=UPI00056FF348|nr:FAD-dependent oxidoreductase [Xenophilus azovorans]MBI2749305.1 FAD-dependent oxidoreductase [Burkholderiales bacterium]
MDVVIIGAGQAGAWVTRSLRESGHGGNITLLGREAHAPYERPALSKGVLSGAQEHPPVLLTSQQSDALRVDFRPSTEVVAIHRGDHEVRCSDGSVVRYDKLVLATGGHPRRLSCPGADLPNVYTLRTIEDSRAIARKLVRGNRLLIIGGGWIGLEIAATARGKQVDVMVLEAGPRLCARSLPPQLSDFLLDKHRKEGVDVRLSTTVTSIMVGRQRPLVAHLPDEAQEFDAVVVGIGLALDTRLAEECGLMVQDGIVVDQAGRTSDPDVYAVGDVANQHSSWAGCRLRFESWANAQNQAIAVGKAIAGMDVLYDELPWFWSDQYDMNLQVLGVPSNDLEGILRGSAEEGAFSVFQISDDGLRSVISVNAPRDIKVAKRWLKQGTCPSPATLADGTVRLDKL